MKKKNVKMKKKKYRSKADCVDTSSINRSSSNSKNLLIAQISNLNDSNKAYNVKHLSLKASPSDQTKDYCALDMLPTAAESLFPWRRDKSYQSLGFGILIYKQKKFTSLTIRKLIIFN